MDYSPRDHNRSREYYFLPPEGIPEEMLCGACLQSKGESRRGGLVVSGEAKEEGVVAFVAYGAYRLRSDQISRLQKIWPKD